LPWVQFTEFELRVVVLHDMDTLVKCTACCVFHTSTSNPYISVPPKQFQIPF
jgi:hypothetical protein